MGNAANNLVLFVPNGTTYRADAFYQSVFLGATTQIAISRQFTPEFGADNSAAVMLTETLKIDLLVNIKLAQGDIETPQSSYAINFTEMVKSKKDPKKMVARRASMSFDLQTVDDDKLDAGFTKLHPLCQQTQSSVLINQSEFWRFQTLRDPMQLAPAFTEEQVAKQADYRQRLQKAVGDLSQLVRALNDTQVSISPTDPGIHDPLRDKAFGNINPEAAAESGMAIVDSTQMDELRSNIERTKRRIATYIDSMCAEADFVFTLGDVLNSTHLTNLIASAWGVKIDGLVNKLADESRKAINSMVVPISG